MRACLVNREGEAWWTDDDREEPADIITALQADNVMREYAYVGTFRTKNHSFRRYQEVLTHAPQ
jgi:hypothetical protein